MPQQMTGQHPHSPLTDPPPGDRSWAARATALKREAPAQWAILAAIFATMTMMVGWVAVLIPSGGNVRFNPLFWLLAAPLMPWLWALQSFAAWAINTLWLALILAPALSLLAMVAAPALRDATLLDGSGPSLDTPLAMLVIMGLTTMLAFGGLLALRRSSLPGGTRPATYIAPGTPPPGFTPLPPEATRMLMLGSLPFSGTLINGALLAIVSTGDPVGPAGSVWPAAVVAVAVAAVATLVFRGGFRLARGRPGAEADLRRGWLLGIACAAAAVPGLWLWPTLLAVKLAFSGFLIPIALAAAWCGRRALLALPGVVAARSANAGQVS